MLFGDDALYYQIVRDAHDPDPAVAWRHLPFRRTRAAQPLEMPPFVTGARDALDSSLHALIQRVRPRPLAAADLCCAPACC